MKRLCLIILSLGVALLSFGQNPLIPDIGMSDPHMKVYGDTLYLYCGHDSHPDDPTWVMKDWRVFTSADLHDWKLKGIISPKDNYMDEKSTDCWAGDGASRNGQYYFYFSDQKRSIGVMKSENPTGPFKDALGKPLVSPLHDPTILVDDNAARTPYIVYGDKSDSYYIARLNEDMISLAENPKPVEIEGEEWEKAPEWMDKNYIFKHKRTYYLTWGRDYATAENPYGPYTSVGSVGHGHHLDEFAHGSFFWWKGQFYHMWCYYIREGYKYRETVISYCHIDDQGAIVTDTDFMDQHFSTGVGQYEASWPKIEAEWYYAKSTDITKRGNREDGFVLSGIEDGAWVKFSNVNFEESYQKFELELSFAGGSGNVEIRADSLNGPLLGTMQFQSSADQAGFQAANCDLKEIKGRRDILLRFFGDPDAVYQLDWINFQK